MARQLHLSMTLRHSHLLEQWRPRAAKNITAREVAMDIATKKT
jgi:hypothetical protein